MESDAQAGELIQADAQLRYEMVRFREFINDHPEVESHYNALLIAFENYLRTLDESIRTLVD